MAMFLSRSQALPVTQRQSNFGILVNVLLSEWAPYLREWIIKKRKSVSVTLALLLIIGGLHVLETMYETIFKNQQEIESMQVDLDAVKSIISSEHKSFEHYIDHNDLLWQDQQKLNQALVGQIKYNSGQVSEIQVRAKKCEN